MRIERIAPILTVGAIEALAELAQVPLARVAGIVHDRKGASFRALYDKAGLPPSTFLAFREALEAMREDGFIIEPGGASRLKRRIIERALTRCESDAADEVEPLLTLLRRFAAEAARDEARLFCDELVAEGRIEAAQSPLRHAPHTVEDLVVDDWDRPYSRQQGCFPPGAFRVDKYWPPVGRVDNAYGDRNLVCTCPPVEDYAQAAE